MIVADGSSIEPGHLPDGLRAAAERRARENRPLTLAEIEANYIREVLAASKGNKTEAARILGISRKNLYERLAREEQISEVRRQTSDVSKDKDLSDI